MISEALNRTHTSVSKTEL